MRKTTGFGNSNVIFIQVRKGDILMNYSFNKYSLSTFFMMLMTLGKGHWEHNCSLQIGFYYLLELDTIHSVRNHDVPFSKRVLERTNYKIWGVLQNFLKG